MITAIEIENFKAFGERQRIELRPITLLFGPNSGGKSSVTHALHYLREVLSHRNLDAHRTRSGGESLDLGGIRNFVHGRKVGVPIRLKVEFMFQGSELPDYFGTGGEEFTSGLSDRDREPVQSKISSASVQLEIDTLGEPTVRSLAVEINGTHFAEYFVPPGRPHAEIRRINWAHPCLLVGDGNDDAAARSQGTSGGLGEDSQHTRAGAESGQERPTGQGPDSGVSSVLESLYERAGGTPLPDLVLSVPRERIGLPDLSQGLYVPAQHGLSERDLPPFRDLLSMLLLGPAVLLRDRLRFLRAVGPLRAMPSRQIEPLDQSERGRWSNGLQAWEILANDNNASAREHQSEDKLLREVSKWLEGKDLLDTGYRLEREEFKQIPSNLAEMVSDPDNIDRFDVLAEAIQSIPNQRRIVLRDVGRNLLLQPQDVGVGLSQIVPVIVALLAPGALIVALEQPELHLHPRQQAALGDALIKGAAELPYGTLLVETHSEHLILRILRRIRETTRQQAIVDHRFTPDQLRIQYIRREGSASFVQVIDVDVNGDLVDPWPDDFFEQDFKERFS